MKWTLNQKGAFLNTPYFMELYTWMLMLALFFSVIRVIRPLTFEKWSSK